MSLRADDAAAEAVAQILTLHLQAELAVQCVDAGVSTPIVGNIVTSRCPPVVWAQSVLVFVLHAEDEVGQLLNRGGPVYRGGELAVLCFVARLDATEVEQYRRLWSNAVARTLREWWRVAGVSDARLVGLRCEVDYSRGFGSLQSLLRSSSAAADLAVLDPVLVAVRYEQRAAQQTRV